MRQVLSTRGKSPAECLDMWASISKQALYDGDLKPIDDQPLNLIIDKAVSYPVFLSSLISRSCLSYRRSWQHIRNNKVGSYVVWFVRRGSLKIVRSQGVSVVQAGEAAILDSTSPFHATFQVDASGAYESHQVMVPSHLFVAHLQEADRITEPFSLDTSEGRTVQRMLDLLVSEGEGMSREVVAPLVDSLLEAVADSLGRQNFDFPRRQRLVDRRLAEIESYIMMNLTDPDLCYDKVATSCGISPRYLCYVLKANNTSFSDMLWKNRLPKARDWLISPSTRDYPINEIAFRAGFKSAAHFSRMFKAAYGCPPREYRMLHQAKRPVAHDVVDRSWNEAPQQVAA